MCYTYDIESVLVKKRNKSCFRVQSESLQTMSTAEKRTAEGDKEEVVRPNAQIVDK